MARSSTLQLAALHFRLGQEDSQPALAAARRLPDLKLRKGITTTCDLDDKLEPQMPDYRAWIMTEKPYEPPAFVEHFEKSPPDVLFHYTGQAGLVGIVEKAELWATKIQYMNDATEFGLALSMVRQELEAIQGATSHTGECGARQRDKSAVRHARSDHRRRR